MAWLLRDRPRDVGAVPYGGTAADDVEPVRAGARATPSGGWSRRPGRRPFWLLAGGFFICGMSTNGLVQPHFIPAAHDHGLPVTTAAGLLAVVGVFDIAGTSFSGWLTDRVDPRLLLLGLLRAARVLAVPAAHRCSGRALPPSMVAFIVFYGLDWVATVPPTLALCREHFGARAPVVFGWVFAAHQLGSAVAAFGGGVIRDVTGSYDWAWLGAGALCMLAAVAVAVDPPAARPGADLCRCRPRPARARSRRSAEPLLRLAPGAFPSLLELSRTQGREEHPESGGLSRAPPARVPTDAGAGSGRRPARRS